MNIQLKNRLVDIFTFTAHLIISLSFVGLGWLSISWANSWRTEENLTIDYFIIIAGIIIFFTSLFILFSHSFKAYFIIFSITIISALAYIVVEGSADVSTLLPIYIIIFTPLLFYKYKIKQ